MPDMLQIDVETMGNRVEFILTGPLDSQGASLLKDEGRQHLRRSVQVVVVDCSSVSFISSSGVGSLLVLQDEAEDAGKIVCYRDPSPEVRSVIRLMDLERILNLVQSEEDIQGLFECEVGPPTGGSST